MSAVNKLILTQRQARRFLLAHQGLWPPRAAHGKGGALEYIRRVGCIQFDPLNIVGHSPELALQARLADFRPALLAELLYKDRLLLDGWDKNMSIYPLEDWPYFRRYREDALRRLGHDGRPAMAILPQVRQEIEARGPLSSIDLGFDQTVDWSWAPTRLARAALESMYFWGELIIHHRVHTRKVYDFASRHLPADLLDAPDPNPSEAEYHDWYVLRRVGSIGLVWNRSGDAWLGMGIKSPPRSAALNRLLDRGQLLEVQVEGIEAHLYMRAQDRPTLERALDTTGQPRVAAILAPLDNLLWERRFVEKLFGFRYVWEVYKPAAERLYGYYVLPILFGERFVARFEPGRDKDSGALVVKDWWWESGVHQDEELRAALQGCFACFLDYLGAPGLRFESPTLQAELGWLHATR